MHKQGHGNEENRTGNTSLTPSFGICFFFFFFKKVINCDEGQT